MTGLSDPTLAVLVDWGQHLPTSDIKTMLMRADIYKYGDLEGNNQELIRSRLLGARDAAQHGDPGARRGLLIFTRVLVQQTLKDPENPLPWFGELHDALLADGYELTWDGAPPRIQGSGNFKFRTPGSVRYKILPTDAAPVPLASEVTALEAEFTARRYTSVLSHYRQAVDGFTNHKYESANGDLRTALEDLVTRLAEDHTGYQRQPRANQGTAAIRHMIQGGHLPEDDGGMLLRGLWSLTHTNGPHPGQSDADQARFRMQVITATARFLLSRFTAGN